MKRSFIIIVAIVLSILAQAQPSAELSGKIDSILLINDPDSARYFKLVDATIDMAKQQGAHREAALGYYSRVTYLADKYSAEQALTHLHHMRDYVEEIGAEEARLYDAWFNVVNKYREVGDVVAATAELQEMLQYADAHSNDYGKAKAYLMFGLLYEYSYGKAVENLEKALSYFKDGDALAVGYPQYYFYMAKVAYNAQKYSDVVEYSNKMLATAQTDGQAQHAYSIQLRACLEMGEMTDATRCYKYLEEFWKNYQIVGPAERDAIYAMGLYLCQIGKPKDAIQMLKYIPEDYQAERLRLQILYNTTTNNYKEAFELQQQLQQLSNQQIGSQQSSDVASANALLNNQTLEREKLNLEISNKSKTVTLAIVIIIALAVIVTVALLLVRTVKKSNAKLKIERDKVEEERNKAVQLNKMKDLFIHNMSHEMRTPLNSIIGFNDLLNNSGHSMGEKERQNMIDHINFHATNLTNMLNHATILNRIDCNDAKPVMVDVNIGKAVSAVVDEITPKLKNGVEIHAEDAIKGDLKAKVDSEFLTIALREVLDNAAKFTQNGIIHIWAKKTPAGNVKIAVKDSGMGVPAEKAETIFNRFEKIGSFEAGFGLGLCCAREVLELMGGEIHLDTSSAGGARFVITLPN